MIETIGKRIARLRQQQGWTQQTLASLLAMSRVAVSHIEMDLTLPGERTITLLAGLFKMTPFELVDGTTYPLAKAERLPPRACSYTPFELDIALCRNDLAWLNELNSALSSQSIRETIKRQIRAKWANRLEAWEKEYLTDQECTILLELRLSLRDIGES